MTDDEIKQLIGSNAKAIEALTNSFNEFKAQAEKDREDWKEYRKQWQQERQEWRNERTGFYETLTQMQRQFLDLQRQMLENQRRIDDKNADIRELTFENQRILRYLEGIVNRPQPPQ